MDEQLQFGESDALIAFRQAWEKALSLLAPEISRPVFESFLNTAKPISIDGNTATIGAASELAKLYLEKYAELLKTALETTFGPELQVIFAVAPREPEKRPSKAKEARPTGGIISPISLPLNDKYVFTNFVVGPCNRLAHAAAKAIAEKPGRVYNPFFLYGGPGLGKTHLLQAIGHHAMARHPSVRIAYVSGELFTSHYVTALREHRSEDFRQNYRSVDILLVDDVQFLAGKERTKEEFFHTFNTLYQMDKQIVLSSDRSPRDLNPFEERLRSRFESGLVVDLAPPDLETRIAILQNKALAEGIGISLPVLECIANLIPTNVRALEGALVTLLAYSSLMKVPLSVRLAKEVLERYIVEKKLSELTPDAIQRAVARAFGVDAHDLQSESRRRDLVTPRHVAMYLSRALTACSLAAIGKVFGGRDHATVLHACRRIEALLGKDPSLRSTVEQLTQDLKAGRA
ncbi:MAG TPA: chromosomal replication initiator protein DnaA [Armatimonadota bacterium]|nr:chromosomal replication initiator protein DnaA [Armatimonadota bacterium]